MQIEGTTALVTGGTGGLGRQICLGLAKAGANVALVYLNSESVAVAHAAELSKLGPRAIAIQADITTGEGIAKMIERTLAEFGRLDTLINDAAFSRWIPFADLQTPTKRCGTTC